MALCFLNSLCYLPFLGNFWQSFISTLCFLNNRSFYLKSEGKPFGEFHHYASKADVDDGELRRGGQHSLKCL